ncbi:hypothetical protein C8F04DRAFT_1177219 [Mycena alexandri]|uniref:Uncharacterized protein n=1 Tax=Mycena alexandri TaxID=1745969 RepID=A0AAD6T8C4_9AGAR|nr:hypothetical protein C8F04DRAFT_1177219 [Mycena alexandri]
MSDAFSTTKTDLDLNQNLFAKTLAVNRILPNKTTLLIRRFLLYSSRSNLDRLLSGYAARRTHWDFGVSVSGASPFTLVLAWTSDSPQNSGLCWLFRTQILSHLNLWRTTDDVVTYKKSHGRSRILHHDDVQYLLRLLKRSPDWFLDELLELLKTNWFLSVYFTTIHRALERAGLSTKDLKFVADERSEPVRNEFVRQAAQYPSPPEYLGFLNETSKNDRTTHRRPAVKRQEFVRGPRVTAVGLTTAGIMTSKVVEGSMKRATYLEFLEYQVCFGDGQCSHTMVSSSGALNISVFAFCSFPRTLPTSDGKVRFGSGHHIDIKRDVALQTTTTLPRKLEVTRGVLAVQGSVRFKVRFSSSSNRKVEPNFPNTTPDLNPIEEAFSKIKGWIRATVICFGTPPLLNATCRPPPISSSSSLILVFGFRIDLVVIVRRILVLVFVRRRDGDGEFRFIVRVPIVHGGKRSYV